MNTKSLMTQAELARELGTSRQTVNNWVRRFPGKFPEATVIRGVKLYRLDQVRTWVDQTHPLTTR